MGAQVFSDFNQATDPKQAFEGARDDAKWEHGHGGYSGSIAEKDSFVIVGDAPTAKEAHKLGSELIDADDPRISDKWGPAGAIRVAAGGWVFFGWASS